jgi:hypothetical protein
MPFIDLSGRFVSSGATYSPQPLALQWIWRAVHREREP